MQPEQTVEGTILGIRVKLKAEKFSVKQNHEIVVFCRAPPKKGKANKEIVKNLKKIFHKKVEIVSGLKSKNKTILIRNCKLEEAKKILEQIKS
ncbi:MAG: DUF167 domain-containing protein [Thermoproteota archaeon]|nr:DUF167 domain-containing protein [Thermoproteota archaeon]